MKNKYCHKILFLSTLIISLLSVPTRAQNNYVKLLVTPTHNNWIYQVGQQAEAKVLAYAGGLPIENAELTYESGNDMMPVDTKGKVNFKAGEALFNFGTMHQAGFRYCKIDFVYEGKRYHEQIKVAFSPEAIQPTIKMPNDFMSYWQKTIKQTRKTPLKAELQPLPDKSTDKVEVSLLKLTYDKEGHSIYGFLCKPKTNGKHPVILTPPGAGIKRIDFSTRYAELGFISLYIDVHGLSPLADSDEVKRLCYERDDYIFTGIENHNNYYFKNIFMACVRAMDYLCALPEADGKNMGVCGGSQGGALSIITAALDSRITFLSAFYPALCDMTGYLNGRAGGWPKLLSPSEIKKLTVPVDVACKTLAYYDVVNFAKHIKVPGFYSHGYNDNTCPPTTVTCALNQITAPKTIVITPIAAHWRFEETNKKAIEWIKSYIR